MHGIIFVELRRFVDARFGEGTWHALLADAKLGSQLYVPVTDYPDADAARILAAAVKRTGLSSQTIQEQFGEALAPRLVEMYRGLVRPEWKTIDIVMNTEQAIHAIVRKHSTHARPPEIHCARTAPNEAVLTYGSDRRLCAIAKGIVRGLASMQNEHVILVDEACMLTGAASCRIKIAVRTRRPSRVSYS
jgi:hypothetical protein